MKHLRLAALALATWLACPSTGGAAATIQAVASASSTTAMMDQYFTVSCVVTNTGATPVVVYALTFAGPGSNLGWTGDLRPGQVLEPGAVHTYSAWVLASAAGSYGFSWSVSASEYGTSNTDTKGDSIAVVVVSPLVALKYGKAVPLGRMEIRNNIIRNTSGMSEGGQPQSALIVVHGTPNGRVSLSAVTASGRGLGAIHTVNSGEMGNSSGILLDGEGMGAASFDGTSNDGGVLQSGIYWIVATGAVNDRKPVLVLTKTQ